MHAVCLWIDVNTNATWSQFTPQNTINDTLQIHRHGDRNIDTVYPNDPYNSDRYWPGGLGELTEVSK